jgi:hypothetical protein
MRSSGIRRSCLHRAVLALALSAVSLGAQQPRPHLVRGVVLDSATRFPIAGVLVQAQGGGLLKTDRSDDLGQFRVLLPAGEYRLRILRIGFAEGTRSLAMPERDTTLSVTLRSVAQNLDAIRIRADVPAVYGIVARLPDLVPLASAKVSVLGTSKSVTTDSTGRFFVDVGRSGVYMVRMVRDGFAEMMFPVEVAGNRAVEASRMLEPSTEKPIAVREHLYAEIDQRLKTRGYNSSLVSSADLRASGGATLLESLPGSRSMTLKGLRLAGPVCIYINGVSTLMGLDAIPTETVESIEVYANRGNITGTLQCSSPRPVDARLRGLGRGNIGGSPEVVRQINIWLKK